MASIASSATSVLIAHVAAHTRTIRLGAGGDHAAQPRAAGHRRAVRHAGDAAPRPHRPRPRPGAGHRPEHDAGAAPRPDGGRHVPAGRAGAAGLPRRARPASPASTRSRARAPTCRSTSSARRCSARSSPPRSACRTRSPRTSRPTRCRTAVAVYRREFQPSEQLDRALRDRGRQRHRRRHRRRRAGAARRRSRRRGPRCSSAATGRCTDEEADALLASPQGRHVEQMMRVHRRRAPRQAVRTTSTSSPSTPTPTS